MRIYAIRLKGTEEYWAKGASYFNHKYTKNNPRLWKLKRCVQTYLTTTLDWNDKRYLNENNDFEIVAFDLVEVI